MFLRGVTVSNSLWSFLLLFDNPFVMWFFYHPSTFAPSITFFELLFLLMQDEAITHYITPVFLNFGFAVLIERTVHRGAPLSNWLSNLLSQRSNPRIHGCTCTQITGFWLPVIIYSVFVFCTPISGLNPLPFNCSTLIWERSPCTWYALF